MPDGRLKIMDFGIAAAIKATYTRLTGHSSGLTIQYSSPEQINGENPSPSMDIYSLGCVFYEMLCGHPPFYQGEILHQQLNRTPDPVPGVAPALSNTVMACLVKDASQRPQSAAEVRALFAGGQTVRLRPAPMGKPATKPGSGTPRVAAPVEPRIDFHALAARHAPKALIAVAGILAIVGGFWLWQSSQKNREQQVLELRGTIVQAIDRGNWTAAEKDVTTLLSLTPQDPAALHWLAQIQDAKKTGRVVELRRVIPAMIGARKWNDAQARLQEFEQLAPGQAETADWRSQIQAALAQEKEVGDLRAAVSTAIQGRDWGAAEQKVARLVSLVPQDTQALEWQKLLREGRREEMVAAEKKQHEERVTELRKTIPTLLRARRWDSIDRPIEELLALAPNDPQALQWRQQATQGRDVDRQAAEKAEADRRAAEERADRERRATEERAQRERRIASLQSQVPQSLQNRQWSEADQAIQELSRLKPDQQQLADWQKRIREGREEDRIAAEKAALEDRLARFRSTVSESIASHAWSTARSALDSLLQERPNDGQGQRLKAQYEGACRRRAAELRDTIPRTIDAGNFSEADALLAELAYLQPNDAQVRDWNSQMAAARRESETIESWEVRSIAGSCTGHLAVSYGYVIFDGCRPLRLKLKDVKQVINIGWDSVGIVTTAGTKYQFTAGKNQNTEIILKIQRVIFDSLKQ